MQILLNIPDKYVSLDKSFQEMILEMDADGVRGIVTILPKGHGRLIDADALYDRAKLCHTEEDGIACVEWREINDAPTIVEADKESEEPRQMIKNCRNCGYPYKLAGKCYSCDDYSQWIPIEADKESEE